MTGTVTVHGVGGSVPFSRVTLEAVVTRADGTVEDLGIIADSGLLRAPPPPPKPGFFQRVKDKLWPKN